ncbi:DUF5117 domain-containing protein [Algoriphagus hitonicola]|uniref:DUF5117 domain-containing protein n=1 Tax=Algoriphagus hitonicola TaxID=435880 RepID=UPI003609F792
MKNISKLLLVLFLLISGVSYGQKKSKRNAAASPAQTTQAAKPEKKSPFKKYEDIVTAEAVSDDGLFKVHTVGDKRYYEIPFELLNTDMLLVSRISKIAEGLGGGYMNAGSKTNEQVIRWSRVENKIHLRSISFRSVANDTLPIQLSVSANNYDPILAAFSIEGFNADSTAALIEVSDLFLSDNPSLSGLSVGMRTNYKVRNLDRARSYISRMESYPENIEVRHDMTYNATSPPSNSKSGTISMEMSQSMYLLPEVPMQPRLHDPRVGWFTVRQIDYGSDALKSDVKTYIRRWRLEPKDPEAYARGELVEPVKPIVYYLDPATRKNGDLISDKALRTGRWHLKLPDSKMPSLPKMHRPKRKIRIGALKMLDTLR